MSLHSLFAITLLAVAHAQAPPAQSLVPLFTKKFTYPNLPYQVTGDQGGIRGPQSGYNICNKTTEGPDSLCQTGLFNDITDFCMWSSPKPHDTVGQSEAYEVAWCTKPGHGARIIPAGAITGVQWLYAKNYVQVAGFIDQSKINLDPTDAGGELDPHGADEQGNPLGGVMFTNAFGQSATSFNQQLTSKANSSAPITQVIEWIDFVGSNMFCLKLCNPDNKNAPQLCNHIYDEIGCTYNAVADYGKINGTFEVCDSDDMTPPGVFTTAPGQTTTWFQPQTGPVVPPYTPIQVASSNCQTYQSTQLFAAVPTATSSSGAGPATSTGSVKSGSVGGASGATTRSGSGPAATGTTSGAMALGAPGALFVFASVMWGGIIAMV